MKKITLKLLLALSISILLYSCSSDEDGIYMNNDIELQDISLSYTAMEYEILNLINEHRKSKGLSTLKTLNLISKEAIGHTNYMIDLGEVNHDNFGTRHQKLVKNIAAVKVAENVAYGYSSAQGVVNAWIKSDAHRRTIENDEFTDFGISTKKGNDDRNYFTHIFVKR